MGRAQLEPGAGAILADGQGSWAVPIASAVDVSAAIQRHAEAHGYSVVREYVGHGIGRQMHEEPQVPNWGTPGRGVLLKLGMALALEPMVNAGKADVRVLKDDWTVVTEDGKWSAHFEHTVALTENGPEILTKL